MKSSNLLQANISLKDIVFNKIKGYFEKAALKNSVISKR